MFDQLQEMVGEAKEGALHGPVVLWRPNQPSHLAKKHLGNHHQNQLFGKQSQHLCPLHQGDENYEVVDKEEREDSKESAEDEEWNENQVDIEVDGKWEDFDLGRDSDGERKTDKAEIEGDEEGNFEEGDGDGDFEYVEGDGRVLFAGHFEEGRPQGK